MIESHGTLDNGFSLEHRRGESGIRTPISFIPFLKEGQRPHVIICVPWGWQKEGEVHLSGGL